MPSDADKKSSVDDISLEERKPTRRSGSGVLWFVFIVVVVIVAAVLATNFIKKEQAEQAAKAKDAAAQALLAQTGVVKANVKEAVVLAEQGNVVAAIAKLQTAEDQYGQIISAANEAGDQDSATRGLAEKQGIKEAREALELEQQRFQEAIKAQLDALRARFGMPASAASQAPTGGSEQPSTADTAPASPAAPAPAATPASPAAPAAPAPASSS
jgi:hypothetical protein